MRAAVCVQRTVLPDFERTLTRAADRARALDIRHEQPFPVDRPSDARRRGATVAGLGVAFERRAVDIRVHAHQERFVSTVVPEVAARRRQATVAGKTGWIWP